MAWYVEGMRRIEGGHAVDAGAVVPPLRGRAADSTLWVGAGVVVQGGIQHVGAVALGNDCTTWAGIRVGHELIVGARSQIRGDVHADGRVVVQDGAIIHGDIDAAADVHLLGDCTVGDVRAGGDIVIAGAPKTGRLDPAGRVQTRAW